MPLFEYKCCECAHEFEELVSSADTTPPCPKCKSEKVEKLMSACAIKADGSALGSGPAPMPSPMGGCGSGG